MEDVNHLARSYLSLSIKGKVARLSLQIKALAKKQVLGSGRFILNLPSEQIILFYFIFQIMTNNSFLLRPS